MFVRSKLPLTETGFFTPLLLDYISGKGSLKEFYSYSPNENSVLTAIQSKQKQKLDRKLLRNVLEIQHADFLKNFPLLKSNIQKLGEENTFTVTTAHQPNLFLGPLYTIYKALSAIRLADSLSKKYTQYNFVPIFWLGSEDHDVNELAHFYLNGEKTEWKTSEHGAFGRFKTESIQEIILSVEAQIKHLPFSNETIKLLSDAYLQNKNIASATRHLLIQLFGDKGLVVVDGDDAQFKNQFKEIIKNELLQSKSFQLVNEANQNLSLLGYQPQAQPREINLFYLKDSLRERIVREESNWKINLSNINFTEKQLLEECELHPENFSPNVILRPLYQATVLPDVAFVGGGAEMSYHLELKRLFEIYKLSFPVLFLRSSVLFIDKSNFHKLAKLNIAPEELFKANDVLIKSFLLKASGEQLNFDEQNKQLEKIFSSIKEKAVQIDPTLDAAMEAEKVRAQKQLESIAGRILKAEKRKQETSVQQIQNIRKKFFPDNTLQERRDNFIEFYAKYGKEWIDEIFNNLEMPTDSFTILAEK
jgi:bacillithiol synthase